MKTIEVYIDDMMVEPSKANDQLDHLRQIFDILEKYKMRLDLTKCTFKVLAGKILGHLVTQRGIEANPN